MIGEKKSLPPEVVTALTELQVAINAHLKELTRILRPHMPSQVDDLQISACVLDMPNLPVTDVEYHIGVSDGHNHQCHTGFDNGCRKSIAGAAEDVIAQFCEDDDWRVAEVMRGRT